MEYAAFGILRTFQYQHKVKTKLVVRNRIFVDTRENKSTVPLELRTCMMDVLIM